MRDGCGYRQVSEVKTRAQRVEATCPPASMTLGMPSISSAPGGRAKSLEGWVQKQLGLLGAAALPSLGWGEAGRHRLCESRGRLGGAERGRSPGL